MKLHPREVIVTEAEIDLRTAISEWAKKHPELTSAEYFKVLLGVSNDNAQSLLKYEIRSERHGNTNKPGGLE